MANDNKCAHPACNCTAPSGEKYCSQYCHDMQRCGGVCEDGCNFRCHGMTDCSSACGDGCAHDVATTSDTSTSGRRFAMRSR